MPFRWRRGIDRNASCVVVFFLLLSIDISAVFFTAFQQSCLLIVRASVDHLARCVKISDLGCLGCLSIVCFNRLIFFFLFVGLGLVNERAGGVSFLGPDLLSFNRRISFCGEVGLFGVAPFQV